VLVYALSLDRVAWERVTIWLSGRRDMQHWLECAWTFRLDGIFVWCLFIVLPTCVWMRGFCALLGWVVGRCGNGEIVMVSGTDGYMLYVPEFADLTQIPWSGDEHTSVGFS